MLPYSLVALTDCLPGIHVPTEPFDPNGEWDLRYAMWNPSRGKSFKSEPSGSLRIRRRLTPDGHIRLQVTQVIKMQTTNGSGITKAGVTCKADDLATPIRWKVDSEILDLKGKQVPLTAVSISGEEDAKTSRKLTSNWSLFDAVQRLPFDSRELRFDMLEEMELLRPDQILWPGETAEVKIGGRKIRLYSFEHIGRGILPFTYWLNDNHRLIIAVGGRRAFLLDSKAGGVK